MTYRCIDPIGISDIRDCSPFRILAFRDFGVPDTDHSGFWSFPDFGLRDFSLSRFYLTGIIILLGFWSSGYCWFGICILSELPLFEYRPTRGDDGISEFWVIEILVQKFDFSEFQTKRNCGSLRFLSIRLFVFFGNLVHSGFWRLTIQDFDHLVILVLGFQAFGILTLMIMFFFF